MKSQVIQDGPERAFALVFDVREEVVAGLTEFAKEQRLRGAHLTAIGAFERATIGFFDMERKDYRRIEMREQVEVLSLVGNVARDERNEPKVHAHVVLGKSDGTAHGGHLLAAYVRPTLEVVITESAQSLCRTTRPEFGLALLDLPK